MAAHGPGADRQRHLRAAGVLELAAERLFPRREPRNTGPPVRREQTTFRWAEGEIGVTGGPNGAYDLCQRPRLRLEPRDRTRRGERHGVQLSTDHVPGK